MNLGPKLGLRQDIMMTPQLQQAIKLLQLSRLELEQYVETQLAENPILEESAAEADGSEESVQAAREQEHTEQQAVQERMAEASNIVDKTGADGPEHVDWETLGGQGEEYPGSASASSIRRTNSGEDDQPNYENMVTRAASLNEHLMGQVGELDFDEGEKKIATVVIGNIDDKGYLTHSVQEIAQQEGFDPEAVEGILDTIQRLDPPGVGARDLRECLLLQLRANHLKNGIVEKMVEHHLTELETRNYAVIAKALKIPVEKVVENAAIIGELEPVPGRPFGGETAQYIVPDVYVFKLGNEWVVSLNEEGLPRLRLNSYYKGLLNKKEAQGSDRTYLQVKYKDAVWLIKSIQQRQKTIFRVAEKIVARQRDFFDLGVEHLRPMVLRDIAEDIGMHESTISRVTTNKYVHTPRGIFELKYFFNSSVARADGDSVASESVKRMISDLVKAEDPKRPVSDQRIVELLEQKGIQLARRTVAKYREQLNILPSSKRRKYF
jgi:RNA polymerase sigma-54 factor